MWSPSLEFRAIVRLLTVWLSLRPLPLSSAHHHGDLGLRTESLRMANKRTILETLGRDELVGLVDSFSLEVADRRAKAGMVEVLARSRKAKLEAILAGLSRDSLKRICRELGLSDSGRAKADLVERILGRGSAGASAAKGKKGSNGNSQALVDAEAQLIAVEEELEHTDKLTTAQLERYLWAAADILRGQIDSSDYKNYIFGLLFLKRISDVFEEEAEKLIAEGLPEDVAWADPDEHQFFVPERARWSTIGRTATNIGETLNKACSALEEANSSLEGVLAGIDFNDERRLGNAKNRDAVLSRLVQHFGKLNVKNAQLSEPDMLGRAYEYLIEKFADDAGKKGGEFYTPRKVVQLIVEILAPTEGMRICDPTCGSGGMLIECAHYVERKKGNARNLTLHGQEKNLGTWAICKMNMLLHGLPDVRIEKGDTIRDPRLVEGGELMLYDRVIANPPFSLDEWGVEMAQGDGFGRFRFGIPPKTKGDLAFVQHMVATLNMHGRLGVVMPHGVLFRAASEGRIRAGLVKEDLFEAVIGLPANLFYGTGIPAAILVLNRAKPRARRNSILFIDASKGYADATNQALLRAEDVERISACFAQFEDVPKYARVVPNPEVEANDFNLNISRYIDTAEEEERIDIRAALTALRQLERERSVAEGRMNEFLSELGYDGD